MDSVERVEQVRWLVPPPNMVGDISIREVSQNHESVIVHMKISHFRAQMFLVFGPPLRDDLKLQLEARPAIELVS
jgi:hypothetical protein